MKAYRLAAITVSLSWIWFSCQTYEITLDNPIDVIADSIAGVFPPALTMHPLTQTVANGDSVTIGSYIVEHDTTLAGVHTHVTYDAELLQLDTILPVFYSQMTGPIHHYLPIPQFLESSIYLFGIWVLKVLYPM